MCRLVRKTPTKRHKNGGSGVWEEVSEGVDEPVGGVVLGLTDEAGVRKAFDAIGQITSRIGARDGGVLVSAMAPRGREVVVGLTRDLQFGHAVMFGLGGTLVEVLGDVAFRIVPVTGKDAAEMIAEIRGARILQGVRGGKPADVAALRQLLVQVSDLVVKHPEIAEMDLNPVIVYENGLLIVDARIVPADGSEWRAGGAGHG